MNTTIPPDAFAQEHKKLSAEVNRLRDWSGSDDSKTSDLADALVMLGAHRLRGHLFSQAVKDAQEALSLSVKLLTSSGPLGPYTPASAARRVVVAAVHLATIQTQAGQVGGAALTLGSADAIRSGAGEHGLMTDLSAEPDLWERISRARIALSEGDAELAGQWIETTAQGKMFQELDRLTTQAVARWALGSTAESIASAWQAVEVYETNYLPVLLRKGISSARATQLAQPLAGIYSDLADRLIAAGEVDTGTAFRRKLIEHLGVLVEGHRSGWRSELVTAKRWLADDLLRAGRSEQAEELFSQSGVRTASSRPPLEPADRNCAGGELVYPGELAESMARARVQAVSQEAELVRQSRIRSSEKESAFTRTQQPVAEEARKEPATSEPTGVGSVEQFPENAASLPTQAQLQRAARIAAHEEEIRARQAQLATEAEQAEDELVSARARLEAARVIGDRQGEFAAAQAVADELRTRFGTDPDVAVDLVEALKELAVAQRQNGDWWGSRKPAKEARELARKWLR